MKLTRDPQAFPYLEPDDIDEALRSAASLAEDETLRARCLKFPIDMPMTAPWDSRRTVRAPRRP